MKTLYVVRHGQTYFNVQHRIQGWCDSPLTDKGIEQAKQAHEILKDVNFDTLVCSTSERCCDTMEYIAPNQPYQRSKDLRERWYGEAEGEVYIGSSHQDIYGDTLTSKVGGESAQDVKTRVSSYLQQVCHDRDSQVILAVSSGVSIAYFLETCQMDPSLEAIKETGVGNCCILKLTWGHDMFTLVEIMNQNL